MPRRMAGASSTALVGAFVLALLAGCGGDDQTSPASAPTPTPRAAATPTPTPTATPPAMPAESQVRFPATDGKPVRGRYARAPRWNAPAVVLLHEVRGGPEQWEPLIPLLHEAGFATLAYESRPSWAEAERLPDAAGAVRWLRGRPGVDHDRIALVGASIGASTAVLAMATQTGRTATDAVALSPPDSADIWRLQDRDRYRPHDLLLIADERESDSAKGMLDGAVGSKFMQSEGPGHGVALLAEEGVRDALLGWLRDH
jgi:BAAT / Acyl-CoA thioester hydrolase C terminal